MKFLRDVFCCLFSALCVEASYHIKEVEGGQVTFPCSFMLAWDNYKYFCKGTCSGKDILVKTNGGRNVTQGRYSIEEYGRGHLFVTIKDLQKSDSGTYWCGVERSVKDTYQEVYLTVTDVKNSEPNQTPTSSNLSTMFPTSTNIHGPSSAAGVMNLSQT
ncbi:hypothetical protein DPEC_G00169910 [Dallia pectoralis]|uniref:Uncharacterized protein n=1 Tax=Dallia pectoralis TaxID=75939 RepID=A0ACC2GD97_DALPE|nr:hypothetical protein DPEC_G00169910 [Dallia pectoralis]